MKNINITENFIKFFSSIPKLKTMLSKRFIDELFPDKIFINGIIEAIPIVSRSIATIIAQTKRKNFLLSFLFSSRKICLIFFFNYKNYEININKLIK